MMKFFSALDRLDPVKSVAYIRHFGGSMAVLGVLFSVVSFFSAEAWAQSACDKALTTVRVRHLGGVAAFNHLVEIFSGNQGLFTFNEPAHDREMFIKVIKKAAPHFQTIDFGFRAELKTPDEHFTNGWKLASLHNPVLRDWHQAVKEKLFGTDFIRLHLTERILVDGSREVEVVQRIRLSDDEDDRSLSFNVKLSPLGKLSEISGKGNYLTIEHWGREEYFSGGTISFVSKP